MKVLLEVVDYEYGRLELDQCIQSYYLQVPINIPNKNLVMTYVSRGSKEHGTVFMFDIHVYCSRSVLSVRQAVDLEYSRVLDRVSFPSYRLA